MEKEKGSEGGDDEGDVGGWSSGDGGGVVIVGSKNYVNTTLK